MLLRYLEKLHELQAIDEVWSHHVDQMAEYGFDRLLYGLPVFAPSIPLATGKICCCSPTTASSI